jgi:Trimethylamine:corrinoid methyltransferase
LSNKHTLKHFKNSLWPADLFCKDADSDWRAARSPTTEQKAENTALSIVQNHKPQLLPNDMLIKLRELANLAIREMTG